ncbi:hypothetical protein ANCDUO_11835 [Ancylostoma duodenale]|uniref:Uncharacterized protein n=1 Tax=Ancylostoma duodenale TaxID=51022 RepID=A0A0C2D788_9BILA|nr:hypothetical protein ANCDUO_11835 [Ancylostoma duodenale]
MNVAAQGITTPVPPVTKPYVDEDLEIRFALYTGFGILVCISSFITILVFSSKDFRKKYIMFFALSVGDLGYRDQSDPSYHSPCIA